ncbi:MAG TPA: ABC transporter permease [Candidatus Intestinimonas pullistercoris]|uniref:ABC transporter permease n=1 Tax=Candidatus Intestinimonas pullistercoris TaxID=2838623 RepID=A0A9D2P118_9FIRM|nr:ABC transporter permease [Candidatus Intestinimonas pullistercoris]
MTRYLLKRIGTAVLTVFVVAVLTFFLMRAVPGNPFLSEKNPPQSVLDALNEKYALDQPLAVQFVKYMGNLLRGDLGVSVKMQKDYPVTRIIADMFPVSATIGFFALLWAVLLGVPLGCLAAYWRGRGPDSALRVVCTIGVSLPSFVVASLLLFAFCGGIPGWKLFPTLFRAGDWRSYVLPCLSLGFYPMCYIARQSRASMLDALGQEYIKTARAKGLSTWKIVFKHALRNALLPVLTYLGPQVAFTLCGGFVVETVFTIPGLGRYFVQSISNRDYPVIMGTTLFLASFLVGMNLLVDLLYKAVDPRIHLGREGA